MTSAPFVLVGLGSNRSNWLARVSHWVTSGALPAELSRCATIEEFRAGLITGPVSMALVDELSRHLDRDLLAAVRGAGAVPVVVCGTPPRRDWMALGAAAVLTDDFDLTAVAELLRTRARPLEMPERPVPDVGPIGRSGRLVAVCGPGGTGTSTVACALAQGLAQMPVQHSGRRRADRVVDEGATGPAGAHGGVLLADAALNGEQAVLHGVEPGTMGLPALVDAHRRSVPAPSEILRYTVEIDERNYRLVTGIRRRRAWVTMRPRALQAALSTLLRDFALVVADTDADVEGEPDGGSLDVEERNALSRCVLARADAVVVVAGPGVKGCYSLLRTLEELWAFGVPEGRVVPVVNRGRGGRNERAELTVALQGLTGAHAVLPPVFLPDKDVEAALVDGRQLPTWLWEPVTSAVRAVLANHGSRLVDPTDPVAPSRVPVAVGSARAAWDECEERPA